MLHLTMADGEATTFSSFSESDGNSLPSGSVHYSTDLSEDSEVISDTSEEVDQVAAEVLPYLFEPERRDRKRQLKGDMSEQLESCHYAKRQLTLRKG